MFIHQHLPHFKVLLTGGPNAGKSSMLPCIKSYLQTTFFCDVYPLPEAATQVIQTSPNLLAQCTSSLGRVSFQHEILYTQLTNEANLIKSINSSEPMKPIILIYDRGLLDGKAFSTPEEWHKASSPFTSLSSSSPTFYHLILHLESLAVNPLLSHHYSQNSPETVTTRAQDSETAAECDLLLRAVYQSNPNWHLIPATKSFDHKIHFVLESLLSYFGTLLPPILSPF